MNQMPQEGAWAMATSRLKFLISLAIASSLCSTATASDADKSEIHLTVGLVPVDNATAYESTIINFIHLLRQKGLGASLARRKTIPKFTSDVRSGEIDVAIMTNFDAWRAQRAGRVVVLGELTGAQEAIVFSSSLSSQSFFEELSQGAILATPPSGAMATRLAEALVCANGGRRVAQQFHALRSHEDCFKLLDSGEVQGCLLPAMTRNTRNWDHDYPSFVLGTTPLVAMTISTKHNKETRNLVTEALIEQSKNPQFDMFYNNGVSKGWEIPGSRLSLDNRWSAIGVPLERLNLCLGEQP